MNLNKVFVAGRLARDIELRYTATNTAVANSALAINRKYKTKDGESREEVTFIDCEAWGKTAEVMNEYLSKGRPVFIEGRLKLDQWQDKDGSNRSKLRVVVESFQFIDSNPSDRTESVPKAAQRQREQRAPVASDGGIDEDSIPF